MIKKLLVLCAVGVFSNAQANLITNGDFSAGLTGWTVTTQAGSSDTSWFADTVGTSTPLSEFSTSAAGGGAGGYAVTDQFGPGATALTQSFTVAPGSTVTVMFDMFVNDWSRAGPIANAAGLDYTSGGTLAPNQHARVDILTAGAGALSTLSDDIVATLLAPFNDLFSSNPNPFTAYSFDISSFVSGGGTFQIRFAEVDNQLFFNAGVDNVTVNVVPEPATLALLGLGLAGIGFSRRKQ